MREPIVWIAALTLILFAVTAGWASGSPTPPRSPVGYAIFGMALGIIALMLMRFA